MQTRLSVLQAFLAATRAGALDIVESARQALLQTNGNASRNTYITLDQEWTIREAERQRQQFTQHLSSSSRPLLYGLPVSIKDCFDLEGFKTSSGAKFYAEHKQIAYKDSAVAASLKLAGAVITGKTHMQQLAYGITGENLDYGDCLQPNDPTSLTGGSSSGAAASIQEGSALAAIGTDTGGSIRVPAALCGLAGYRSSVGVGDWAGGAHLAPSFDTIGWLFKDLRDAPILAEALFHLQPAVPQGGPLQIGYLTGELLDQCDESVTQSMDDWKQHLLTAGARLEPFQPDFWSEAWDIYTPIQAYEAAKLHTGFYEEFEPAIAERLKWGASISETEVNGYRSRMHGFRADMQQLFERFDFLLAPTTPVSSLPAGADHSKTRASILRHTTPGSLCGLPALVLPSAECGVQLMAKLGDDARLLALAEQLGKQLDRDLEDRD
jgi:aspartyl-tRNA(Asn)/glutamyl-tRNA(Gln) amidotransferase subunit A